MSESSISWYSMDDKLAIEEHGVLELQEALRIVDRYLARGSEKFKTGEEAIVATTFGFSRSKSSPFPGAASKAFGAAH